MDRKTLEYMTDRTKKATAIVRKIDELSKDAERIIETTELVFKVGSSNVAFIAEWKSNSGRDSAKLVANIKTFVVEAINQEIKQLEEELAAL
ncbi:hypothetical protein M2105_006256 [Paenibacillus sp. PastF-1]|uniref:hypothetical protein n=2 Tax=Paenibacillus TaxID=44249 RepID=UPI002405EE49|nr:MULTISPECIES: hypothetical protein [unclassified Paenibacillus]MDF9845107.1 hypothetical protein [Paenibacillus sp. PastF-2]MDF9851706.1 hypothetical protein [Paenibacillus sp. PastM-2]MDF9858341.1 hypothetical protein [Paenibacillus sp. PastF-1]MDH6483579.1 hypothetical protein [Paenibacillus sp. PastH-2]MDH6511016.1 hypothetical protein [Paenibacillus sp. PastM-3]